VTAAPRYRVWSYRLPFRAPVVTGARTLAERRGLLVEVFDTDGYRGWGDSAPLPGWSSTSLASEVAALRGWDGRVMDALPGWARTALHGALLDLAARRARVSLASLLRGQARVGGPVAGSEQASVPVPSVPVPSVPVNAFVAAETAGDVSAAVTSALAAGHRAVKLKVAGRPWSADLERIRALAAAADGVEVRLDANGAWSEDEARAALAALAALSDAEPSFDLAFVEQPVAGLAGLARLRGQVPVRVAADEAVTSPADLERAIAMGAADVIVLKPTSLGGPASTVGLARRAAEAGLDVVVTSFLESAVGLTHALHVAAAVAPLRAAGLATAGLFAADVATPPPLRRGRMPVPEPGLGVSPPASASQEVAADLAQTGAGKVLQTLDGPWGTVGRELGADVVAQLLEAWQRGAGDGHEHGGDPLTPHVVGSPHHGDGGHGRVTPQHGLDSSRPDVLAPTHDEVTAPAEDLEPPIGTDRASVVGGQPASGPLGVVAVPVAAQQHGTAYLDLAVDDAQLDAVERHAVVHDASTRLGQPVGGHHVGGPVDGCGGAAHQDQAEQGRVDAGQGCGDERHECGAPAGGGGHGGGVETFMHLESHAAVECPGDHAQATDVAERQAGQPPVRLGVHTEPSAGGLGRGGDGRVRQHDPLGLPHGAARGHDEGVARLDGHTAVARLPAVGAHHAVGAHGVEQPFPGRRWEPAVEGQHRIAVVPGAPQLGHELRSTGPVQGDQALHGSPMP
jgi:L-Ala-D/L-Glu epimerase